jgi:hypothetical protein
MKDPPRRVKKKLKIRRKINLQDTFRKRRERTEYLYLILKSKLEKTFPNREERNEYIAALIKGLDEEPIYEHKPDE